MKLLDSPTLARGLGLLVLLYGAFALRATMRPPQEWQVPPTSIARLSGVIGGAVGTTFGALTSLSFAVYFDAIRMPVDQFRATLTITVPMTLIGIYLGNRMFAELSEVRFRRLVGVTLVISGFALLVK